MGMVRNRSCSWEVCLGEKEGMKVEKKDKISVTLHGCDISDTGN